MELDVVTKRNCVFYYKKGTQVLHNPGGPSLIIYHRGHVIITLYYLNGKIDRKDGPAFIAVDREEYFRNGHLHNANGPAAIWKENWRDIPPEYYLKGVKLTLEEWEVQRKFL